MNHKKLLLELLASLTLCEHMGDVSNEISTVLTRLNIDLEWDDFSELGRKLADMGITTLMGTKLGESEL